MAFKDYFFDQYQLMVALVSGLTPDGTPIPGPNVNSTGQATDAESSGGDATVIAILKRLRTLLGGTGSIQAIQATPNLLNLNANLQVDDTDVALDNPVPGDVQVVTDTAWTTIIDGVRLDDDPTAYNSPAQNVEGWSAVWVLVLIDSTLNPTDIQILAQFSDDAGTTWWDFVEGLWGSLFWEDTDTASGLRTSWLLPLGGIDHFRIRAVATGSDATNYFNVTVRVRAFRGNFGVAHS